MSLSEATKYAAKTVWVATVRLLVESRQVTTDSVSQMRDQSEASKYAAKTVTQVSTTRRLTTSCLVPKTTDDVHCYGNGRDAMPTEETFFFFESQRKIEPATRIYL